MDNNLWLWHITYSANSIFHIYSNRDTQLESVTFQKSKTYISFSDSVWQNVTVNVKLEKINYFQKHWGASTQEGAIHPI